MTTRHCSLHVEETLEYHHDKHHKAYVDNGNKLAAEAGMENCPGRRWSSSPSARTPGSSTTPRQHYNHIHFWKWMKKGGGGNKLPGKLQKAVDADLGGYDKFRADFIAAGTTQFGSGWAWVSVKDGKLAISKTPNGENPLVQAHRRSSASMSGSIPITSTIATPAEVSGSLRR